MTTDKAAKVCVICEETIIPDLNGWGGGHNAQPVAEGQCCGDCNERVVMVARLENRGACSIHGVQRFDEIVSLVETLTEACSIETGLSRMHLERLKGLMLQADEFNKLRQEDSLRIKRLESLVGNMALRITQLEMGKE